MWYDKQAVAEIAPNEFGKEKIKNWIQRNQNAICIKVSVKKIWEDTKVYPKNEKSAKKRNSES